MGSSGLTAFERSVEITLGYEGEESNDPRDPGGFTRYGIAQKWHPKVNVAALTRLDALDILEREYWFPIQGELLPWPLCAAIFDHGVHSGPGSAAIALQRAVGARVDGKVGPLTRAAVGASWDANPRRVLGEVLRLRARELVRVGNPAYINGWLARLSDLGLLCGFELGQLARRAAA